MSPINYDEKSKKPPPKHTRSYHKKLHKAKQYDTGLTVSVHNQTKEKLLFHWATVQEINSGETTDLKGFNLFEHSVGVGRTPAGHHRTWKGVDPPLAKFALKLSATWQRLKTLEDCPWRVFRVKITDDRHAIVVIDKRDASNFLGEIPDSVPISGLLLPGTHQTMAFRGWPIAQCQSRSTGLTVQLNSGIRVLDIRISLYSGTLETAHDILPMGTKFRLILQDLRAFLTGPGKTETVVMSIKQEDYKTTDTHVFSAAVRKEIETYDPAGLDGWFLENRVPTLGEVRGKVILFSRFGSNGAEWEKGLEGLGIHPTTWPDSDPEGFEWTCAGTRVRVQDWYRVPTFLSIPEKLRRATHVLTPDGKANEEKDHEALAIAYMSASAVPFALPPTIARGFGWPNIGLGVEGVNARLTRWALGQLAMEDEAAIASCVQCKDWELFQRIFRQPRVRGWVLLDFFKEPKDSLVPLLIELNFRGRAGGEEGWPVTPQLPPWEWGLPEHVKAEKIQKLIKERDEKERLEKERLERGEPEQEEVVDANANTIASGEVGDVTKGSQESDRTAIEADADGTKPEAKVVDPDPYWASLDAALDEIHAEERAAKM